jgi:hypothetical protein
VKMVSTMLLQTWRQACICAVAGMALSLMVITPAGAERIPGKIAVFAALDKVTARISKLEVELNKTVTFGSLRVTPRACFTRPPTEPPKTTAFVDVQDEQLDGSVVPLFSGWMFAQSPGLHAVEHPVFDVWLTDCGKPAPVVTDAETAVADPVAADAQQDDQPLKKRRVKRQ